MQIEARFASSTETFQEAEEPISVMEPWKNGLLYWKLI